MVTKKVVWDKQAKESLRQAYKFIKENSPQQAERIKKEILEASKRLSYYPEMHPPDKYRKDNDTRFRTFEKYNYRLSYFISDEVIRVLRFRHIKQAPKEYWILENRQALLKNWFKADYTQIVNMPLIFLEPKKIGLWRKI